MEGTQTIDEKRRALAEALRGMGCVAVAFSGGADSALLAAMAHDALGARAFAITMDTAFCSNGEVEAAAAFCGAQGIDHEVLTFDILTADDVVANAPDRCYRCKRHLMEHMIRAARQAHAVLVEGSNASDARVRRPGARAVAELGVRSPLAEVGLTKVEVRELSRMLGLRTWDKPSMPCLATRFPYGTRITAAGLAQVEAAERILCEMGFRQVRVRAHGGVARIEMAPDQLARLLDAGVREQVHEGVRSVGFDYVAADLLGYRMGSADEVLEGI